MEERKKAAKDFADRWLGRGNEKQDTQMFWIDLLENVYQMPRAYDHIETEKPVKLSNGRGYIDVYIPGTKVLIEQKDIKVDLNKPGRLGTAYEQAQHYVEGLPYTQKPRWIITSNFQTFQIYDQERPNEEPVVIKLDELEDQYATLDFLIDQDIQRAIKEEALSVEAAEKVSQIYNALLEATGENPTEKQLEGLNILCVRLVFLMFAEDAGLLKGKQFTRLVENNRKNPRAFRYDLIELFRTLDTDTADRTNPDKIIDAFPYIDGGLFADQNIFIPELNARIIDLILSACNINWKDISPTIFGAAYESTINSDMRRKFGMHYTSIENIHKVIDPLFLDDLKVELEDIKKKSTSGGARTKALRSYIDKLASLKFLDPACGSGNFLTETYLSLRRLENEALKILLGDQVGFGVVYDPIKVSLNQFYGIELNDFAVSIARAALFIAEYQMVKETEAIINQNIDFLPLKNFDNIKEGNALRMDWNELVPAEECSYIMGNPPFVGYSFQSRQQKTDLKSIYVNEKGKSYPRTGKIDYVSGWFFKAAQYIQGTDIHVAFVATNSITQGDQVTPIWKPIFERFGIHIDFAHTTFQWANEAHDTAKVYCVIIGFSNLKENSKKLLYSGNSLMEVEEINFYLKEGPTVFINSRNKPICSVPLMKTGNRPADGGHLIIEEKDYESFLKREPKAAKYIKRLIGSKELLHNQKRYCLWLKNITPKELNQMPEISKRVKECKKDRLNGAKDRQKLALKPWLFRETFNPNSALVIPKVSSSNRIYIPMSFIDQNVISTDLNFLLEEADNYIFGILTSRIHTLWLNVIGGRLGNGYRYSRDVVYNNFPWPEPTAEQKAKIEKTAQAILDARDLYPDSSLADLYDPDLMPIELRKAHEANDRAVMEAYGFDKRLSEEEIVGELMKLYQKLTTSQ